MMRLWKNLLPVSAMTACLGTVFVQSAWADQPATQLEQGQDRLQNSGPLLNQTNPATVRDSFHAAAQQEPDSELDTSDKALGGLFGARVWLARHGITFTIQDINEVWGNVSGGTPSQADGARARGGSGKGSGKGAAYDGVTMPTLQIDLEKFAGLEGGLFNVSAIQARGRSISQDHLGVFNPISGFEADRSTRLFELWYQQGFFNNTLDIKIGQQDLDTEFLISDYGSLYLNANFGWPMAPSANLYAGGPSWPLASPAVRVRYRPAESFTFMFAAADDNPPGNQYNSFAIQNGGNLADPTNQVTHDGSGTKFNMGTGALLMTELQYAHTFGGKANAEGGTSAGLPGVYKLGGYYDTASFPDYRWNNQGVRLGSPDDLTGIPRMLRGNWLVYGIIDQMIWRSSSQASQSLGVFVRATGNGGDRNLIGFAMDAGINLKAPFAGRENDTVGLGWGIGCPTYGQKSYDAISNNIVKSTENHLELTYQAQVTPWLVLQPDFQYIWRPGGGIQDYSVSYERRVANEAIFGLHSSMNF